MCTQKEATRAVVGVRQVKAAVVATVVATTTVVNGENVIPTTGVACAIGVISYRRPLNVQENRTCAVILGQALGAVLGRTTTRSRMDCCGLFNTLCLSLYFVIYYYGCLSFVCLSLCNLCMHDECVQ